MYKDLQSPVDYFYDAIPFIMEGQVVATDDPDQMGRVKAWVPSLDGENFEIESLPWTEYASPFFGFTVDYPAGQGQKNASHASYGFWAIPKIGATVLVFCLNADPARRFYFASTLRLHRNRSLPVGRNKDGFGKAGPWGDAGDGKGNLNPIQPAYDNLREQFQNKVDSSEAITRGAFERQVAQEKEEKDGAEGYSTSPVDASFIDAQTYCFVTPGRHALIFQDDPKFARLRVKTAEGHQVILDDANERIYVSTSKGKSWLEMDADGHVHIFSAESFSVRSGKDMNFFADRDVNIEADRSINIKANGGTLKIQTGGTIDIKSGDSIRQSACKMFDFTAEETIRMTADRSINLSASSSIAITGSENVDIKAGGNIIEEASQIHLNGPAAKTAEKAECAEKADAPEIVPGHEPWTRPQSSKKRGPYWKA